MTAQSSAEPEMPSKAHPRRLMRITTASESADVSRSTIYRAINAGDLEAVKLGTATAIPAESFERWIAGLPRVKAQSAT